MKATSPSKTAMGIAGARTRESLKPPGERVCFDPYAIHFLDKKVILLRRIGWMRRFLKRRNDRKAPGMFNALVIRTRYMDDCLIAGIEDGINQLVILGAGYDTRAFRIEAVKTKNITVFEVDHPATQQVKKNKIKKIFNYLPNHAIFVPVRFNSERLDQRLIESGYDPLKKTLFILEGVSMYISADALEAILAFVAGHSPIGSRIIFDFFPPSIVDGTCRLKEAQAIVKRTRRVNEKFLFGADAEQIDTLLKQKGFANIRITTATDLKSVYFRGVNSHRQASELFSFADAAVAEG